MGNERSPFRSRKDGCIQKLEQMILSGQVQIGQKLPTERRLAETFQVSRPVVHEAIVELAAKGLVRVKPRKGVIVNDFRTTGSPALLTSLFSYQNGDIDPVFFASMVDFRLLLETEIARLAALHRSEEQVEQLAAILAQEVAIDRGQAATLAELDFAFHQVLALASGNMMYPLVLNSFRSVYLNITSRFFACHADQVVVDQVLDFHRRLLEAVSASDSGAAAAVMAAALQHAAATY